MVTFFGGHHKKDDSIWGSTLKSFFLTKLPPESCSLAIEPVRFGGFYLLWGYLGFRAQSFLAVEPKVTGCLGNV